MKIKIIRNVIAVVNGENRKLTIGNVVEARTDEADNLVRGGYAVREQATKVVHKPTKPETRKGRSIKAG